MGRKKRKQYEWLPKHVTVSKGYFVYRPWINGAYGKQVSIGRVGMLKSDFFKKYEAITNNAKQHDLHWLFEKYEKSDDFNNLSNATKRDRRYYYVWMSEKYSSSFGSWSDIPLSEYSPILIRQFMDSMDKKKTMANHILRFLRVLFNWGMQRYKLIKSNPCKNVKQYSIRSSSRYVEDWEYNAFLKCAIKHGEWYLPAVTELMYLCILRPSESLTIKKMDITETHVLCERTKGSLPTRVKISPRLQEALDLAKNKKAKIHSAIWLLYDKEGQPIKYDAMAKAWDKVMEKFVESGGKKFKRHELKHKGVTDNDDIKASGHKTESMRLLYKHSIDETESTK